MLECVRESTQETLIGGRNCMYMIIEFNYRVAAL